MANDGAKAKIYLAYRSIENQLNYLQKQGEDIIISSFQNGIVGKNGKVVLESYMGEEFNYSKTTNRES